MVYTKGQCSLICTVEAYLDDNIVLIIPEVRNLTSDLNILK